MSEFKKLRWKYFWQQKWKEIKSILIPTSIVLGMYLIGIGLGFPGEPRMYSMKMVIAGAIMFGFWILVGIYKLIKALIKWIKSNWQKATERAIEDLKPKEEPDLIVNGDDLGDNIIYEGESR